VRRQSAASYAGSTRGSGIGRGFLIAGMVALVAGLVFGASVAAAAAPTVTIEPASEIGVTSAKAKGTVDPGGKETNWHFEYITDEAFQVQADAKQNVYIFAPPVHLSFRGQSTPDLPSTVTAAEVQSALNALSTIGGVGGSVTVTGDGVPFEVTFGGSLAETEVETIAVETEGGAGFAETSVQGHAPGFGGAQMASGGVISSAKNVEATLEKLAPETTYHVRLVAENADSAGTPATAVAPTFETDAPTAPALAIEPASPDYTRVHLAGTVDPEGGNVNPIEGPLPIQWEFQYRPVAGFGEWFPAGGSTIQGSEAAGTTPIPVFVDKTEIQQDTEYEFRLVATYAGGLSEASSVGSFETEAVTPPEVTIDPVTALTGTTAHFSGSVTPGETDPGFNSQCAFLYITDAQFQPRNEQQRLAIDADGGTLTLIFNPVGGAPETTGSIAFDAVAGDVQSALQALPAIGAGGVTVTGGPGGDGTHPFTITFTGGLAATNVNQLEFSSALIGNSSGLTGISTIKQGHQGFEGATEIPCTPSTVTGSGPVAVSADPTDLLPGNTYHLRLRASNLGGTEVADTTFQPPAIAPAVRTGSAHVSATGATITGGIDTNGAATTYYFAWGPDFAQKTPEQTLPAGNGFVPVSASLTGLAPSTSYEYRLVATNPKGSDTGADRSFTTDQAVADPCPNAAFRTGFAANLPECRAYELVNPPGRDFGDVMRMVPGGDDGNHTGFTTMVAGDVAQGAQDGSFYLATRTPSGWVTTDSNARLVQGHDRLGLSLVLGYSTDFKTALLDSWLPFDLERDTQALVDIYTLDVGLGTAHLQSFGPGGNADDSKLLIGASKDLSRVVFNTGGEIVPGNPTVGEFGTTPIYVREGEELSLVTVLPDGTKVAGLPAGGMPDRGIRRQFGGSGVTAGVAHGGSHGISDDAERIFFYAPRFPDGVYRLYERDYTTSPPRTVAVSISEKAGDSEVHPGIFIGASHDGSVAYFDSPDQLTDDATPGGGVYRFELNAPAGQRLELLTPASPNGEPLKIKRAIASDDSSHVYFMTSAVLTGDAVPGKVNAYVWSEGSTRFITSFIPHGENEELGINSEITRVSRDGRFALFTSRDSIDGAANNGHRAVYEYDAVEEEMACVSCRPDGSPSEADSYLVDYPHAPIVNEVTQARNITDDGTVFFSSEDRLVKADQTTYSDVYEYKAGKVWLLTSGQGNRSSFLADNSDDGTTVFVMSPTAFDPRDRDANELDAYAIRINGGFPPPPPPAAACEGEACRNAATSPPPNASPVTPAFIGPDNSQSGRNQGKKHHKKHHHKKHHKKKHKKNKKADGKKRDAGRNGRTGR
jgi:hypothetical protein